MIQYNNQQNEGLMNRHSSKTMTPYNNQQEGYVSSAAVCTQQKNNVLDGRRQNHPEPNGLLLGAMAGFTVAPMTGCSMDGAPGGIGNGSIVFVCCRGGLCHTGGNVIIARRRGKGLVGRQQLLGGLNERPSNGRVGWATTRGMNFVVASIRGFLMNDVLGNIGNGSIGVICCQEGGDARQVALSSSLGEEARVLSGAKGKDERRAHTRAGVVQDPAVAEPGLGIQLERTPPRRPGGQQGVGLVQRGGSCTTTFDDQRFGGWSCPWEAIV